MKTEIKAKAEEMKEVLCAIVDGTVAVIKGEKQIADAQALVGIPPPLLASIERYLRTEHAACSLCGEVFDADRLDFGRCAACEVAQARQ